MGNSAPDWSLFQALSLIPGAVAEEPARHRHT
jgi:hypothetical protein